MLPPAVTVLMPVYNAEKYLREAIESVLLQSFADFEFLIINDASTDTSVDIIQSFSDPRIKLVENERNLGISATLNKGISLASTDLIARMDADDISYPARLQKQVQHFSEHPDCVLVSAEAREISEEGTELSVDHFEPSHFHYMLNFQCWIYHPTVMYRKQAVEREGGYTERYCEDYDLWWKMSRKSEIGHLPEVLLDYRHSSKSLSKVTHNTEYEAGHRQQLLRNVRYYTGEEFDLTIEEIEALRFNCGPLSSKNDLSAIATVFKKLDRINRAILGKERNGIYLEQDRLAAAFMKDWLIQLFMEELPVHKKIILLRKAGYSARIIKVLLRKIKSYSSKLLPENSASFV